MSAALEDRTVLLPEDQDNASVQVLANMLAPKAKAKATVRARLISPDSREAELPDEVYHVIRQVVTAMAKGQAVLIEPLDAVLTTQEAADRLHISRPTLVKLLEAGKIPFHKRGRHRRVRLADLLAYEDEEQRARQVELDTLSYQTAHDGTADQIDGFVPTR